MTDLAKLEEDTLRQIDEAADEAALEAVRLASLGKKGAISALLATLGKMSPEERKTEGAKINALKDKAAEAIAARREQLAEAALETRLKAETLDMTLPAPAGALERGRIHPISQVTDELSIIFADMGFAVAEGPDIESDDYNFTKLNFPEGHPAREMQDTFFLTADVRREAAAAHPYEPGAGAHHAVADAADPGHLPWPGLSLRLRPDAYADVPSDRRTRHR